MNPIQWHLMLGHVPVVGIILTTILFCYGFLRRNREFEKVSLYAYVFFALLTVVIFLTGDAVQQLVEGLPGLGDELVGPHKTAGLATLIAMEALGAVAMAGIYLFRGRNEYPRGFLTVVLGFSVVCSGLMAWTAHTGTHIHHMELFIASQLKDADGIAPYLPQDASEKE